MPVEDNRRDLEYEAPTSSQRDSEVSNSYAVPESNPQDNKVRIYILYFIIYFYVLDITAQYSWYN